jgi:hypothetical protein
MHHLSPRSRASLLVAATVALAACEGPSTPTAAIAGPSLSRSEQEVDGAEATSNRREHELRNSPALKSAGFLTSTGTGIYFHGGTVLQSGINIQTIYWASTPIYNGGPAVGTAGAASGDGSLIGTLLSTLGGSSHYNINSTYTDASGRAILNKVSYNRFWANGTNVPANGQNVTDGNMLTMLQSGFSGGQLTYDPNTLYVIFTAGTVNLGGGAGSQYCAYHTHGTVTINGVAKNVYFAAMPYDYAWPAGCTNQSKSPNNDPAADAEINTLVHEIEETHTDAMGNAWYDRRGYENADKCAWNWGTTKTDANGGVYNVTIGAKNYLIQQNWVNSGTGGCRQSW